MCFFEFPQFRYVACTKSYRATSQKMKSNRGGLSPFYRKGKGKGKQVQRAVSIRLHLLSPEHFKKDVAQPLKRICYWVLAKCQRTLNSPWKLNCMLLKAMLIPETSSPVAELTLDANPAAQEKEIFDHLLNECPMLPRSTLWHSTQPTNIINTTEWDSADIIVFSHIPAMDSAQTF